MHSSSQYSPLPVHPGHSAATAGGPRGQGSSSLHRESSLPSDLRHKETWSLQDFDVGPKLGQGRFGKIYLCREKVSKYAVVLKLISKEAVMHYGLQHQMQREVELHMYAKHRHVLRMLAFFWDDERLFLVLDYADGGNLLSLLSAAVPEGRLPEATVAQYTAELCSAVWYLHRRGILHRDIKPENILLKKGKIKLADFTWAVYVPPTTDSDGGNEDRDAVNIRSQAEYHIDSPTNDQWQQHPQPRQRSPPRRHSRRMTICGTIDYLPPEMVLRHPYDAAVDMWSVGATVYEMLVGVPPFETATIRETEDRIARGQFLFPTHLSNSISWEAKDFVSRLLQVNPKLRMTAAQAVCHPFIAARVEEEKQRVRAVSAARSEASQGRGARGAGHQHHQIGPEGSSLWFSSHQHSRPTPSMREDASDHAAKLQMSAISVSVSSFGGGQGSMLSGLQGGATSMVHQCSGNTTGSTQLLPSDVTASTVVGHDDAAVSMAVDHAADRTVERALQFDTEGAAAVDTLGGQAEFLSLINNTNTGDAQAKPSPRQNAQEPASATDTKNTSSSGRQQLLHAAAGNASALLDTLVISSLNMDDDGTGHSQMEEGRGILCASQDEKSVTDGQHEGRPPAPSPPSTSPVSDGNHSPQDHQTREQHHVDASLTDMVGSVNVTAIREDEGGHDDHTMMDVSRGAVGETWVF